MIDLKLALTEQDVTELKKRVDQSNLSVEQLLVVTARNLLTQLEDEFQRAIEYVLQKNQGLMVYLTLAQILELHCRMIEQSGGGSGVRDFRSKKRLGRSRKLKFLEEYPNRNY